MCIRSGMGGSRCILSVAGAVGGLHVRWWSKNIVCKTIKAAITHHGVHALEFPDALCNARFNEAIPFVDDLVNVETGRHERGDKEPLETCGEHGRIDICGTCEMGEREAERIIRIDARGSVVFEEGALWQVSGGDVGRGSCGRLFLLGGLFGGGSLGGRDRRGGGDRRRDTLLNLYGGIDDPGADVGGCEGLVEICCDGVEGLDRVEEMLWEGGATGDEFECHDLGAESIYLVRGERDRGRGRERSGGHWTGRDRRRCRGGRRGLRCRVRDMAVPKGWLCLGMGAVWVR